MTCTRFFCTAGRSGHFCSVSIHRVRSSAGFMLLTITTSGARATTVSMVRRGKGFATSWVIDVPPAMAISSSVNVPAPALTMGAIS